MNYRIIAAIIAIFWLIGCTHLGPKTVPRDRFDYNSAIADSWKDALKLDQVGVTDNFFDLGGHSMLIVHVMNQLRNSVSQSIVLTDLFRFPTIRSLGTTSGPT